MNLQKPQFIADQMLGRLAKWLRILGFDTLYHKSSSEPFLISLAQREKRILLTRNRRVLKRRQIIDGRIKFLLIDDDRLENQLFQVVKAFDLKPDELMNRCFVCNSLLEVIEKEKVKDKVPPYVFQTQKRFSRCPKCERLYWKGTHWNRISEEISGILSKH